MFVIASIFLHWNLAEYRNTDFALVVAYVILVVGVLSPLILLQIRLENVKAVLLTTLPVVSSPPNTGDIAEAAKRLRDITVIRDWQVSAFRFGVLVAP
jgi:hypothetical protein